MMGSNDGESDEKPVHKVCLDGFWIGKYEVTQGQYEEVMGSNPSSFKSGKNYPLEMISWDDAMSFAEEFGYLTGKDVRLLSEAQWEYACMNGGEKRRFCAPGGAKKVGWYEGNSEGKTHPVGQKRVNKLGIYDMSGNVWEWVRDRWHDSYAGAPADGTAWVSGKAGHRVLRGGSWSGDASFVRSAYRSGHRPGHRFNGIGFRLSRAN